MQPWQELIKRVLKIQEDFQLSKVNVGDGESHLNAHCPR